MGKTPRKKIKIHREGAGILVGTFLLFLFTDAYLYFFVNSTTAFYVVTTITAILFLMILNFFRSPIRVFPEDTTAVVVSPADGRVVAIEEVYETEMLHCNCYQISVFMSIFNVHANWFPVNGKVEKVEHHMGRFLAAYLPKSSMENEHTSVLIDVPSYGKVLCRQIAGAIAKRIVTYAREDADARINHHLGFIKFGSRVDVFIPLNSKIHVDMDQSVVGNQTVIAELQKER